MTYPAVSLPIAAQTLSPDTWPIQLDLLPLAVHLVGGSVRDALLNRRADYLDLDFVLSEAAIPTARAIAKAYKAGFVLLDAEHQIARVVFGQSTLDFAQQVGNDLESDLQRRDFTVNAIAFNPHTQALLDPLNGIEDLNRCCIRMIAAENLAEDPLRLLRAYRQAAQLGFHIDPATQVAIRDLAPKLANIAAERVQGELNYLLGHAAGTPLLAEAWINGLFQAWLPEITSTSIQQLTDLDRIVDPLLTACPAFAPQVWGWMKSSTPTPTGRSWLRLAKLTTLLSRDPEMAETQLWQLKYSRAEIQAAIAILRHWDEFHHAMTRSLSRRHQYELFQAIGSVFPALILLGLADGLELAQLMPYIERYLDPNDVIAHPSPLVTGRDLMTALNVPPSPQIGQLLKAIELAQAEGHIATSTAAIAWVRAMVNDANDEA